MAKKLSDQAEKVWLKGVKIPDKNKDGTLKWSPDDWRRDANGKVIKHDDYGDRDSDYGWEIDHIVAVADGGTDALSNLRPLYWRTNVNRN